MKYASTAIAALLVPFAGDTLPTIDVQGDNGPVRINVVDFDASKHTAVNPAEAPAPAVNTAPAGAAAPVPPAPPVPPSNTPPKQENVEQFVTKIDKKFFITDKDGKPLDAAHPGFDKEAEAQAALKA